MSRPAMAFSSQEMQDCWSDSGVPPGVPCRPGCVARPPQVYPSDTSLKSCNSFNALKQWTSTAVIPPPTPTPCCRPATCRQCGMRVCSSSSSSKRNGRRRSMSNGDELVDANDANTNNCTTTRKRLLEQDRCAISCLMSDTSDDDRARPRSNNITVDNGKPALVELMSCDSSFSDCSLPSHQLITCSGPTQLAQGRVKVSVRPPLLSSGGNQCYDDDRFNIKFVSHFTDVPDQEQDGETKKRKGSKTEASSKRSSSPTRRQSPSRSSRSSVSSKSSTSTRQQSKAKKGNKNKSARSRDDDSSFLSTSDQSDLENKNNASGNSNRVRQRRLETTSSNVGSEDDEFTEEYTQGSTPEYTLESTQENSQMTTSSFNDDTTQQWSENADFTEKQTILPDTYEQEILMLYGKLREIIRGPAVMQPSDVKSVSKTEIAVANEDKETFSAKTVITDAPQLVTPIDTTTVAKENSQTAPASVCDKSTQKSVVSKSPIGTVQSPASTAPATAPCKANSDDGEEKTQTSPKGNNNLSSSARPRATNNGAAAAAASVPPSRSAQQMSDNRYGVHGPTRLGEYSPRDDTALVVARRTKPTYSSSTMSPWIADQSLSDGRSRIPVPQTDRDFSQQQLQQLQRRQQQQQQQQHQNVELRYVYREQMKPPPPRRPRNELVQMYRECLMTPLDDVRRRPVVDPKMYAAQSYIAADMGPVGSSTSLPPVLCPRDAGAIESPPRRLMSCLKKSTSSGTGPIPHAGCEGERRRRIRFATELDQEMII